MTKRKDEKPKWRLREGATWHREVPCYARNTSYRQSVLLGLRYGLWDLPANLVDSILLPLVSMIALVVFIPMMIAVTLIYAGMTVSAGLVGCVSPPREVGS